MNADDAVAAADIVSSDDCETVGELVCSAVLSGLCETAGELEESVDTVGVGFEDAETSAVGEPRAEALGELVTVPSIVLVCVVDADMEAQPDAESRPVTLTDAVEDCDATELVVACVVADGTFDVLDESVTCDESEFCVVIVADGQGLADGEAADDVDGKRETETVAVVSAEIV